MAGTRHVLFPFSDTVVGGSYVSASILTKQISSEEGWRVTVCLPAQGENARLFQNEHTNVRYMQIPEERLLEGRRLRIRRQWRLRFLLAWHAFRVIREERPDLVHINDDLTMLTWGTIARLLGVPVVWHVRQEQPTPFDPALRLIANQEILIAAATGKRFDGKRQRRSIVIHNVTDVQRYKPPECKRAAKAALGFPENSILAGFVGRLHPDKRAEWAIETALAVSKDFPRFQLLVAGREMQTGYMRRLERLVGEAKNRNVHLLGPRDDIPEIMRALDLLLVPSIAEPFGLVVIEAMASGVPVLATRAGGVVEIIDDYVTGRLVDPSSYNDFLKAAEELVADVDLRERLGHAGRKEVLLRFSSDRIRRETLSTYSNLLGSGSEVGVVKSHDTVERAGR